MRKNKKKNYIGLGLLFLIGLSILLYPMVSDAWNRYRDSLLISDYSSSVSSDDNAEKIDSMWKAAQAGDWATVKAEQDRLNEISHIWDVTTGVQGYAGGVGAFKTAMNLMGIFDSPTMPRPVKAMTGENVEAIRKVLQDNGLL